jgi:hypothetical protein
MAGIQETKDPTKVIVNIPLGVKAAAANYTFDLHDPDSLPEIYALLKRRYDGQKEERAVARPKRS